LRRVIFIFILTVLCSAGAFAQNNAAETGESQFTLNGFRSDGCTWFPEGNYRDCCVAHDREYFAGGSWSQRWRSDKKLFRCVAAKSKFYNKLVAPVMWLGVRAFAVSWLNTKFSWGFGKKNSPKNIKKKKSRI
jgi:hypothetical protein